VSWLESAVCEVRGELQLSLEGIRLFGRDSSTFNFEGETENVFTTNDDEFL